MPWMMTSVELGSVLASRAHVCFDAHPFPLRFLKHGRSTGQGHDPVSTRGHQWPAGSHWELIMKPSIYLDRAALHPNVAPYR